MEYIRVRNTDVVYIKQYVCTQNSTMIELNFTKYPNTAIRKRKFYEYKICLYLNYINTLQPTLICTSKRTYVIYFVPF